MTKADIVRLVARGTGLTRTDTSAAIDSFTAAVIGALEAGEHIEIRGFGTLKVLDRAPRTGRNPRTGAEVRITSRRAPVFRASRELRARVENQTGDKRNALWPEEKAA